LASSRWASGFHPSKNFFNPFFIIFSVFSKNLPYFLNYAFFKGILNKKQEIKSKKVNQGHQRSFEVKFKYS
jgi:hypothetical protein